MAYINVAEWTPDQVTDWLKGLDETMYNYSYSFTNNEVGGQQLLNIRPYELEQLGMCSIGHQEIVLEAVENLRNFHFNLDKENLQFMALHVATAAHSLNRQLATNCDESKLETRTLNDITRTVATIKPLIGWLERAPFQRVYQFNEICRQMLRYGLEMATIAHRDRFVERPVEQIRSTAEKMERLANYIIQEVSDPMVLQPASLNLVTFKKRESELGFNIDTSYQGIHRITDIKYNSPAHNSGKIEDGDEIVQINYQTVVGWQDKTVLQQLRESVPDVLLTLKKRPKHTKIYGQIYVQPYRLPSKKRVMATRWGENLPSPRPGFLKVPDTNTFNMPLTLKEEEKAAAAASSDTDSSCSDILTPTDAKSTEKEIRLYYPKPRTMLQRRNTICGDEFLHMKSSVVGSTPLWHERKVGAIGDPASPSLRDKSISFGNGLELATRHTTCIGLTSSKFSGNGQSDLKSALGGKLMKHPIDVSLAESAELAEKSKPGVSKVVRFDASMKYEDYAVDEKYICNVENTILETFEPIPFADEDEDVLEKLRNVSERAEDIVAALDSASRGSSNELVEAVNVPMIQRRGRLDKSHSTPAYDNSGEEESETPPAIEPRKEFMLVSPPIPPPRPRKRDMQPIAVPRPPPKPANLKVGNAMATNSPVPPPSPQIKTPPSDPAPIYAAQERKVPPPPLPIPAERLEPIEATELHTPTKSKTLTLKKKHNLIAKRRNVNLKVLGTGDIQGHLFRRKKDRRGVTYWARVYFVMLDTILYGFRTKDANKASCVMFLPGFTVSLAKEVYSKPFAFKVYHSSKTFYFATESQDALNQWVEFIRQATLQDTQSLKMQDLTQNNVNARDLYSENESSEEENEAIIRTNLCTPSPQGNKDVTTAVGGGGGGSTTMRSHSHSGTPTTTKQDRSYLGSLRKLTKSSLHFKTSSVGDKKSSSDIPVPTDQYRSYRKVPGGSFGIQIGTNTPGYHDQQPASSSPTLTITTTEPIPGSPAPPPPTPTPTAQSQSTAPPPLLQRKPSISASCSSALSSNESSSTLCLGPPSSPAPTPIPLPRATVNITTSLSGLNQQTDQDSPTKSMKKIPYNFIHASNPNLVEFDFQTSKTLDYSLPKVNSSNAWEAHQNIQGFVTLKDLMLRKQEEDAKEMYNNRVLLGVEKKDEHKRHLYMKRLEREQQKQDAATGGGGKLMSKTQNRSLPKTPDYEISFKPDDEDIKRTRTKEGLKLRDFGYELISGDEPIGGNSNSASSSSSTYPASRQNSNASTGTHNSEHSSGDHQHQYGWTRQFLKATHKHMKHSSNSCSSMSSADYSAAHNANSSSNTSTASEKPRTSSFKKKSKLAGERLFHFHKSQGGSNSGTMTLPLKKKSSHNLEPSHGSGGSGGGIKKSITYNNDLRGGGVGGYDVHRKNSAPMPIFSKLSFSSGSSTSGANASQSHSNNGSIGKQSKEKKLLGSPHLHRAIFGGSQHQVGTSPSLPPMSSTCTGREYDREIFSQVTFPTTERYRNHGATSLSNINATGDVASVSSSSAANSVSSGTTTPTNATPTTPSSTVATPEYPNMECPPVFEPEIYSLTDPNVSLSLLIRRNNGGGPATNTTPEERQ